MLAQKERHFQAQFLSLEALVPLDNFYRQLEAKLNLSFVRELVQSVYKPFGRPSIDPLVYFKLQLIMFFEGIRSERQLMEMVHLNLAYRWYIGYDFGETVPDYSSLSKIRNRYGLAVSQKFFEKIVQICIEQGLVWGQELYFDGTKVQANAAFGSLVPRFYLEAKQHLQSLFPQTSSLVTSTSSPSNLANATLPAWQAKYHGTRLPSRRKHSYKRKTDRQVSLTDPDASLMSRFKGDKAKLGYHSHYVVDGGRAR
jgi:transposase